MENISAFIVDDDDIALRDTEMNLSMYCPEIKIIGKFLNPAQAIEASKTQLPKVVFVDIQMEEMSGIDLAKEFEQLRILTVFISSYSQFALQALKTGAVDLLIKPIKPQELIASVQRIKSVLTPKTEKLQSAINHFDDLVAESTNKFIALPTISEITIADMNDIIYCQGLGNYTKVIFKHETEVVLSKTISLVEKQLDSNLFVRIHSKYLVNLKFVSRMLRNEGSGILVMENGASLPLSRSKRKQFLKRITIL
jgi:two-component system LytT family response regulator